MVDGHNAGALQDISSSVRAAYGSVTPGVWPIGGGNGITMTPVADILDNPGALPGTLAAHDEPSTPTGGRTRAARRTAPTE